MDKEGVLTYIDGIYKKISEFRTIHSIPICAISIERMSKEESLLHIHVLPNGHDFYNFTLDIELNS